ncbi:MAG TPA: heavy metal-associated domain-containing protein [Candidatus Ozemobacteraceae bacterium]|nr:heavy metal-associated domain-containing protein [Candidatus Ozemobacteraceae bacterium]
MKISWSIPKMKCDGCVQAIAETLLMMEALKEVTVDLSAKKVEFEATDAASAEEAKRALVRAGFPPA